MLQYILQTVIFQLLFLLVYDVFLRRETFFNWNRFYLLASAFLSIVLPFIKLDSFKEVLPKEYIFKLPEVVLGKAEEAVVTTQALALNTEASAFVLNWYYLIYLGCAIALVLFIVKLINLFILAYKNPKTKFGKTLLIELINSTTAFSFFNYIFLGDAIKTEERKAILAHELEHVKQKHSLDLLFFEVLRILFWFNPLIYIYQNRIANLHEFIADSKAVKLNKKTYYQNLLSQVFDTNQVSFINPFFKSSLIKKRIIMLSKNKSKQINLIKYMLLIPLIMAMLSYTSAEAQEKTIEESSVDSNLNEDELFKKYVKEIKEIEEKVGGLYGLDKIGYYSDFNETESYIQTKDRYIRNKAHKYVYQTETVERSYQKNKDEEGKRLLTKFIDEMVNKTYAEYLEEKKTPEAIKRWEDWANSSQYRKYVKDLDNISEEEQKIIDNHIKEIEIDEYYNELIISDGLRHKKIEVKKQNKIIETVNVSSSTNESVIQDEEISFAVIDQVPVFPGCEGSEDQKQCISSNINMFVAKNFNLELGKKLGLSGKQKIQVFFTINKVGDIKNIKVRAPHPELEKEARRVVNMIPKLKAGEQNGKPANVTFFLPITFNIQGDSESEENIETIQNNKDNELESVSFTTVQQAPVYRGYNGTVDEREFTVDKINKFVVNNFNLELGRKLGLKGEIKIQSFFIINKEGIIKDIKVSAQHPELVEETRRIINLIPKFKPGEEEGKLVDVSFYLPITMYVNQ